MWIRETTAQHGQSTEDTWVSGTQGVARPPFWCHTNGVLNKDHMNRPEVLLTAADYLEDIKARWEIHQYEVNKLREDIATCFNAITDAAYYTSTGQFW